MNTLKVCRTCLVEVANDGKLVSAHVKIELDNQIIVLSEMLKSTTNIEV